MSNNKISNKFETFEDLYDKIKDDNDDFMDEDAFMKKVEELVDANYILTGTYEDRILYSSKPNLEWSDFSEDP